jgi:rod shape-determining protein MreB
MLAVDVGTSNTVIYATGRGIVLNEPSIVAFRKGDQSSTLLAVGREAASMLGKTPANIKLVRPVRQGVVIDIALAEKMLKHFIRQAIGVLSVIRSPDVIICVPSGATDVQRRAIRDTALNCGARQVYLVPDIIATAIGSGLAIHRPEGVMVVNIGGGTTKVGVLSLGGLVLSHSLRMGGDNIAEAIGSYLRREHALLVGEGSLERLKCDHGLLFATAQSDQEIVRVRGRQLGSGVPVGLELRRSLLVAPIVDIVDQIVAGVRAILEKLPPEIAADLCKTGIVLSGGSAQLDGFDRYVAKNTNLPVCVTTAPQTCAAVGAAKAFLDDYSRAITLA